MPRTPQSRWLCSRGRIGTHASWLYEVMKPHVQAPALRGSEPNVSALGLARDAEVLMAQHELLDSEIWLLDFESDALSTAAQTVNRLVESPDTPSVMDRRSSSIDRRERRDSQTLRISLDNVSWRGCTRVGRNLAPSVPHFISEWIGVEARVLATSFMIVSRRWSRSGRCHRAPRAAPCRDLVQPEGRGPK